jgi:hypothetical protein
MLLLIEASPGALFIRHCRANGICPLALLKADCKTPAGSRTCQGAAPHDGPQHGSHEFGNAGHRVYHVRFDCTG